MAAIGTADVSYVPVPGGARLAGIGRTVRQVQVIFPNNGTNNQYQTGGVPLLPANMGFPRGISSLRVVGIVASATPSMNPVWQWNGSTSAPKLVGLREAAAVADAVPFDELAANTTLGTISQAVTLDVEAG